MKPGASSVVHDWALAGAPPPALTVSEWADKYRILPETSAARGARWRTSTAEYLRGIMDGIHEPGVKKIALRKCHQSGGSEALNNILGYSMHHAPSPMLLVHPTADGAESYSKERLADMIRTTAALRAVVQDKRMTGPDGRPESTLSLKMFPGGFLALGGANSPNTFARWSVRLAIGDDVDRFPPVVGEEGDPADLLVNRTTTFHDGLTIFCSTPTLKGGRIDTLYEQSDQRRYFVPCPRCGVMDFIAWSDPGHLHVAFENRDAETAHLACPACGGRMQEPERGAMVAAGEWRSTAPPQEAGLIGFHVPAMLSPFVTQPELVAGFLAAHARGRESLRVFVNTQLAEGWEDRGAARMQPHALHARREDYGEGVEVPEAAAALTCGVDVQADRFELVVMAWGAGLERWVVDWRTVPGNPKAPAAHAALLEALSRRYRHALGVDLPIHAVCIDSGFATEQMYDFVLAYQVRRIFATKGVAGRTGEPIVGKASQKTYGRGARPVLLYPINVDDAKAEILASIALPVPGPGAMHFPSRVDTVGEEFFAQLCAEHRETRYNRSGVATHTIWVQDRERNDVLDCAVLSLAALRLLNPNLRDMLERIQAHVAAAQASPVDAKAAPASSRLSEPPALERRITRSRYVQRLT
jgi:phage terminase large subunit GpA-like protein